MICPHKDCGLSEDCQILEITKKIPKNSASCSYARSAKRKKQKQGE